MDLPPQQSPPTPSPGPQKTQAVVPAEPTHPSPLPTSGYWHAQGVSKALPPSTVGTTQQGEPWGPTELQEGSCCQVLQGCSAGGHGHPREVIGMEARPCWPQSGLDHGPDPFLVPWTDANSVSGLGGPILPPGRMGRKTPE